MSDTDTGAIDATIIMWRDRGVGPSGIASALEAEGLGRWTAKAVRAVLDRLDDKAGVVRAAEAVFTPDEYVGEGWQGHGGDKFTRPWLDRVGRDVRDTGCAGEQGDGGQGEVSSTFADRALEHLERTEEAEKGPFENPFGSTA